MTRWAFDQQLCHCPYVRALWTQWWWRGCSILLNWRLNILDGIIGKTLQTFSETGASNQAKPFCRPGPEPGKPWLYHNCKSCDILRVDAKTLTHRSLQSHWWHHLLVLFMCPSDVVIHCLPCNYVSKFKTSFSYKRRH